MITLIMTCSLDPPTNFECEDFTNWMGLLEQGS